MKDLKNKFFQRITKTSNNLTPTDRKIIDYLLRKYPNCMLKNASEIANDLSVNVSTVTRYFQKIGYKSIRDAQNEFKEDIEFIMSSPLDRFRDSKETKEADSPFNDVLDAEYSNLKRTLSELQQEDMDGFLDIVSRQSAQVFLNSGRGQSFALAYYLYAQIRFMLPDVHFLKTDKLLIANSILKIKPLDVLIAFSFRRYHLFNTKIATVFKNCGCKIITITDSPISPVAQIADLTFLVETRSVSPLDSYTAGVSLLNVLLKELSKTRSTFLNRNYERAEQFYKEMEIY